LKRRIADLRGRSAIHVGNGSDGVLSDLLLALRKHHSQAHLPEIGYKIYDLLADRHRFGSSRYRQPGQGLAPAPGVWLIDSPNAITGGVVDRDRLERIASCDGAFVVWDNCYGDFECERLTMPDLTRMAVVRSFSKYYGLAGLRVGYCIADRALVAEIERGKDIYNVNAMALAAAAHWTKQMSFAASVSAGYPQSAGRRLRAGFDVCEHGNFVFVHHHDCHRGARANWSNARSACAVRLSKSGIGCGSRCPTGRLRVARRQPRPVACAASTVLKPGRGPIARPLRSHRWPPDVTAPARIALIIPSRRRDQAPLRATAICSGSSRRWPRFPI
jgi:histidinol-phosphate/aromatic aminotransferase/cobyric acid decarboxylase-like protein